MFKTKLFAFITGYFTPFMVFFLTKNMRKKIYENESDPYVKNLTEEQADQKYFATKVRIVGTIVILTTLLTLGLNINWYWSLPISINVYCILHGLLRILLIEKEIDFSEFEDDDL